MTRSIGSLDRIRWLTQLAGAGMLSLALVVALAGLPSRLGSFPSGGTAAGSAPAPALPAPRGSTSALDPRIASLADRHPEQRLEAIVQFKANVSPERARWDVTRAQGHVFGELHIINALAVKLTAERARWLAANPDVHSVSLNATVKTEGGLRHDRGLGHDGLDRLRNRGGGKGSSRVNAADLQTTYDQTLNATGLWRAGIDGAGIGVAVVDTGIDGDLADFQGANGSRVVETAVTNPDARTVSDSYGHGTDVAGIIAGNGNNLSPSNPLRGQYIGVAPAANLISIKAADEKGNATVLDVIYGLQFAVDHQSDYNIRVVNLSLDAETPQSYRTDPLDAAAESAWMHGIVVVAAAGNLGGVPDAVQYAPANDPYVVTVGAVDENGTADPSDDFVPNWSSQGTTQDGFQKPDVNAPGAHIMSVLAPGSVFASLCPTCTLGGEYIRTSGTSMATAAISGLVADILEAHPTWTPDEVKGALTSPGVASNASLQEADGLKVVGLQSPPQADGGLTPNEFIDASTGNIDYSRSTWSRSTWSTASGSLSAAFARSSWSCTCSSSVIGAAGGGGNSSGDVDSSRSSWSRSSWSTYLKTDS